MTNEEQAITTTKVREVTFSCYRGTIAAPIPFIGDVIFDSRIEVCQGVPNAHGQALTLITTPFSLLQRFQTSLHCSRFLKRAMNSQATYLSILGIGVFLLWACFRKSRHAQLSLPPGPTPLPLIGNVLDMPVEYEYVTYSNWGKTHGDVVHVTTFGIHIIILNSIEACTELLERRSAIYSDRPYFSMILEPSL